MSRTVSPSKRQALMAWPGVSGSGAPHAPPSIAPSFLLLGPNCCVRPGLVGPMPHAALLQAIRPVLGASSFHGEGHRKVWARLRVAGLRTSKRRGAAAHARARSPRPHALGAPQARAATDGTIIPEAADTMRARTVDDDHHG